MIGRRIARGGATALLGVALGASAAPRPEMSNGERDALSGVRSALEHRSCELAIARLNDGLAKKYPDVYVMAGAMYEQGLCLKANWDRATRMYQLAHHAGHGAGQLRLIAGYAYQRRDPAAALWWAAKEAAWMLPAACRVPAVSLEDPDAFVAVLQNWPAGKVDACTYVAGVMAAINGEIEYPVKGSDYALDAKLRMSFVPATATVSWTTIKVEPVQMLGLVDGDALRDRSSRAIQDSFRIHLEAISAAVLKRYDRPDGIDPDWRLEQGYEFRFRYH